MIRAHRVAATAQDDASMVAGWNISPNIGYTLILTPGASACGVLLFDAEMSVLIASGAALVGATQPCILVQNSGVIRMVDADLGWHLLITTDGTESQRTIRISPAVDLPDEISPIYGDDDLAVVRATAGIDGAVHYIDDLSVTCPLGLGAWIGDITSVPLDGVAVLGQVESITWTGTPNGATEAAVIRRHVAIAPEPHVDPAPITPPTVADDAAETDAETLASGNVLTNDEAGLTVVAVNGLTANVGVAVAGSNGGVFTIASNGAWTFDPDGDFAALEGTETAETSVAYYASDGVGEVSATLTVTVISAGVASDPYWDSVQLYIPMTGPNNSTVFTDAAKNNVVTRSAPLLIQTGTGPQSEASYGYCALSSNSTAAQLSVADNAGISLGAQDFCIEWFYRPTTLPSSINHPLFFSKRWTSSQYEIMMYFYSGVLYFYVSSDGANLTTLINAAWSPQLNQWYHMRISRSGSTWRLWINGAKFWQGTWSGTIYNGNAPLMIMGDGANAQRGTWSMCHFRLTVGQSRETTDVIDIPSLPYPTA